MSISRRPQRIPSIGAVATPATLFSVILIPTILFRWTVPLDAFGLAGVGLLSGCLHTGVSYYTGVSDYLSRIKRWLENGAMITALGLAQFEDVVSDWVFFGFLAGCFLAVTSLRWWLRRRYDPRRGDEHSDSGKGPTGDLGLDD